MPEKQRRAQLGQPSNCRKHSPRDDDIDGEGDGDQVNPGRGIPAASGAVPAQRSDRLGRCGQRHTGEARRRTVHDAKHVEYLRGPEKRAFPARLITKDDAAEVQAGYQSERDGRGAEMQQTPGSRADDRWRQAGPVRDERLDGTAQSGMHFAAPACDRTQRAGHGPAGDGGEAASASRHHGRTDQTRDAAQPGRAKH